MAGAPKGNKNASKQNRLWGDAIKRAIAQHNGERLRKIAEKLLDEAEAGNIQAIKELGDRLDGRSAQQVVLSGDPDTPILQSITRIFKHG